MYPLRRILPSAAACLAAVLPASSLTLREAREYLLRDNPDLAILRLEIERSEEQLREANAAWFPSLDAMAGYGYTTETSRLQLDLPIPPPAGTHIDRRLGDHDRAELGLDASYALFTGFSRGTDLLAKRAGVQSRETEWRGARNRMSLRLAALFHAWQLAGAQAEYQEKATAQARELTRQLQDFVRAGTAVRSSALAAEAKAKASEVDLLTLQNTRDSLAMEVLDFIGGGAGADARLTPDTGAVPERNWEEAAAPGGERPEAEALDQAMAQARFGERSLAGQRLPQLYASAGMRYANPGLDLAGDDFMPYGLLGVQLRWNLFDGSKNRSRRKQFDVQGRVLKEQKRKLENEWRKAMQTARLQYTRWQAQFAAAEASRDAARAAAADLKRQFEAGLATGLDWLEARNNESRAEMMMRQAGTMQRLALLQWDYAAGKELEF